MQTVDSGVGLPPEVKGVVPLLHFHVRRNAPARRPQVELGSVVEPFFLGVQRAESSRRVIGVVFPVIRSR